MLFVILRLKYMEEQRLRAGRNAVVGGQGKYYLDGISRPTQQTRSNRADYLTRREQPYNLGSQDLHQIRREPLQPIVAGADKNETSQPAPVKAAGGLSPQAESSNNSELDSIFGSLMNREELTPSGSQPTFKKRRSKFKRTLKPLLITLMLALVGFGGWFGTSIIHSIDKVFHGNVFSDVHALISGTQLKESNGRINILLAGDSVGDPGHAGAALADSIMVISYDPATKNGFILSIPRDLWVYIPSMGYEKINAANDVSNFKAPGLPSGGMGQLQQIVQNELGIPIDYEALIDYAAFKDAVNTVGGITINIQSPDPRGIYDAYTHLRLPNGKVNLNGQEALDLARARGDNVAGDVSYGLPNSDFSRTQHQRQMLAALIQKALTLGVLSNPVKITDLFNSFSNNISTDLNLGEAISLVRVTDSLKISSLQSVTYSYGEPNALLTDYRSPNGEDALIPSLGVNNFSQIKAYFQQLTSSNPITREGPSVTLLNGSNVSGLATREKSLLESQGFSVSSIADASTTYSKSLIVNNTSGDKPYSAALLEKDIHGQVVTSTTGSQEAGEATNYSSDFVVIMGKDWDNSGSTGTPVQN